MNNKTICNSIKKNEVYLRNAIGSSSDIEYRHITIPVFGHSDAFIVFINKMVDFIEIDQFILAPLMQRGHMPKMSFLLTNSKRISLLTKSQIFAKQVQESNDWDEICDAILKGNTCLFVDNCKTAVILTTRSLESRSISESITEGEIKGPRDGFIESIAVNTSLIRRRIKDCGLRFDNFKLGERTKTDVSLVYIKTLVNDSILVELKARINRIQVDSILESAYIEEFIEDNPISIFPQIEHTERPDRVCSAVLEGRIAILTDNTPFALIVPTVFWNFVQTSGDYYERYFFGTFYRMIRLLSLLLSFTLPSLYVLLASFHQEMLPTVIALKIAEGRAGVPFPALIEAFILDILLEIMKEAGLRMPRPIGQTVSIVGTYIIGQAAVVAGLVSPILVIFITISAICSYAFPSYSLVSSFRLIRFPLLILSGTIGILGFLGGIIIIMMHILSLRSFGEPFFSPVIPFNKGDNKDIIVRAPWWKMTERPRSGHPKDVIRQKSANLKPKPPESNTND
jgi:hypothetical protein